MADVRVMATGLRFPEGPVAMADGSVILGEIAGAGVGFEDVVCVRIFLTEFERDYAAFNRLYTEYFRLDRLPARTTVGVTHLARGGIVEVDLIARRS